MLSVLCFSCFLLSQSWVFCTYFEIFVPYDAPILYLAIQRERRQTDTLCRIEMHSTVVSTGLRIHVLLMLSSFSNWEFTAHFTPIPEICLLTRLALMQAQVLLKMLFGYFTRLHVYLADQR